MHDLYHGPYPVDMTPEEARTELAQQNVAKTNEALERIARIIDPDAWHETLPTDGCGVYWITRRNKARDKARAIIPLVREAERADVVKWLRDQDGYGEWSEAADAIEAEFGQHTQESQ